MKKIPIYSAFGAYCYVLALRDRMTDETDPVPAFVEVRTVDVTVRGGRCVRERSGLHSAQWEQAHHCH